MADLKKSETPLSESEKSHSDLSERDFPYAVLNSLPGIFYLFDQTGRFLRWNTNFELVTEYSSEEICKLSPLDLFVGPDKSLLQERIHEAFTKGTSEVEADLVSRNGKSTPYYFTGQMIQTAGGQCLVGMGIDITARKQAEKALKDSEQKYHSLFEESQDIVFVSMSDGQFVDINPAGISRLGYASKESILPVPVRELYADPDGLALFLDLLDRNGFVIDFETKLLCRDGQQIYVSINATAIWNDLGKIMAIRGIMRDITEHRKLEEQLLQSQKMESIGTLAGGVAHDFNNMLTAIIGYAHLALMNMPEYDPNRKNIEQVLDASERAAHLTRDLLLFSRKQAIDRKRVELNAIIHKTEKFLKRVIGEDIACNTKLHEEEISVLADAHQIEQILMNLATNARDAMPRGGTFTIRTELVSIDERFIFLHGYGTPGMYAMVTVSDTGNGMDEDTRNRIFEPFYTTKEVGKGTGLGLAVVYGIIKQHDGYINVYSELGIGTTFRIYLPLFITGVQEAERSPKPKYPARGSETILLAEDDETVRDLTETVLKDFGYKVITAVNGEDAVSKYLENRDNIQLLLFDLIMPGKNGKEAYNEIMQMKPDVKVLFATGYSPDIIESRASLGNGGAVVYKPISPMDLLKKIRTILDTEINGL